MRASGWRAGILLAAMGLGCLAGAAGPAASSVADPGGQGPARVRRHLRAAAGSAGKRARPSQAVVRPRQAARAWEVGRVVPEAAGVPAWSLVGPVGVNSLGYGLVTGRVSALALDPADATGNHLFMGTTGGGLWSSQNAAASTASSVQLLPVTDGLPALSGVVGAGLSVGAVTVQAGGTGVVLAGLGDPNDALDSYYGAGLLRSADGGRTWTLIQQTMDLEDGLGTQDFAFSGEAFAGFAWSTANVQLVVAAVSQAYEGWLENATDSGSSYEGLYWSNDSGATWHLGRITDQNGEDVQGPLDSFAQPDGNAATAVVWNPVRQVFVAAVRYHGFYQSTDGMNWTQLPAYPNGQPGSGFTAGNCPTEPGGLGVAGCPIFRGSLAVNPQTGDTFAWSVDEFNQDQGIWQDVCAISGGSCANGTLAFGVQLGTAALEVSDENGAATIENGDYNLTLAAVPGGLGAGQDTLVFAGDDDLWKCSLADSCAWRNTTNTTSCQSAQVGEYEHALVWDAGNPLLLFTGTDSGLWRSVDQVGETGAVCAGTDASHWQNLNGAIAGTGTGKAQSLAEVVSLAESPTVSATMLVGLGANGFAGNVSAPAADWNEVLSGEGGPAVIDATSHINSWYANNGAGVSIFHCASAAATVACTQAGFGTTPVIGEAQVAEDGLGMPYPADFVQDAYDPTQLIVGTCRVWRGPATGAGWSASNAISPVLDGIGGSFCDGNALIRSMAVQTFAGQGTAPVEAIYVGMAGVEDGGGVVPGHVFSATVNAAGTASSWTDLAFSPVVNSALAFNSPGGDVSGLVVDAHDATGQTVYAAISGFPSPGEALQPLYRTSDGGAHWTAINSNLPDAPVNAVVVDPQDANTVYVGTDVGVYVTRAVTSCGSAVCWSAYGSGLPLAPVTALTTSGSGTAALVLTAGTYGRGIWQIPTETAGVTLTNATSTPTALNFGSLTVGTASLAQTVTVRVTGNAALAVTGVAFTSGAAGDFTETDNCVGVVLPKNTGCAVKVTFTPSQAGARAATLAIQANVAGGEMLVALAGTGLAGASATLLPASAVFGTQQVGTTSAAQSFSLQNAGGSPLTIASITVSAPFKKSSTSCGVTLAAGSACAVTVQFAPTAAGTAAGSLTVVDGVGTQSAGLSGTGVAGATDTLSLTSLSFSPTVVGQSSAPLTVTLTNSGGLPLTGIGTSVTGPFAAVSNCGGQLAAGSSCGVSVTFTPTLVAYQTGTMLVSDAVRQQSVTLGGLGQKPALIKIAPTAIAFGSQQINLSSAVKTLAVTNTGGAVLQQPSFSISGVGAASFAVGATTCGATLAAQATCTVQLTFTPVASGTTTATVSVSSASVGVAAVSATLTGTGLLPPVLSVSPTALSFGTVIVGDSSDAFTVQVTNSGQVAMALPTFAVSGAQAADFALSPPTDIAACTVALNSAGSCYIQVTFSPSLVGAENATLTIMGSNAVPPTATVSLTGTGAPPIVLQASPAALSFQPTAVGAAAAAQTLTLSNLGRQTANSLALALTGPYQVVPALTTCGATLARDSFCTVDISFTPTASGDQPGALTASVTNLGVMPLTVPLDGTGVAVGGIQTSVTQMTFGSVVVATASVAQTVTVTNSGQAPLTGLGIAVSGDFSLSGDVCPTTLPAQASCTTGVVFTPSTTGIRTGSLTVSSVGVVASVVSLTGNGVQAGSLAAAPPVVSFGSVTLGQTSPAQTVTLSNTGATALAGLQYAVTGDYGVPQNGCGASLAVGAQCSFTVSFTPTQPGTRIGAVTVSASTLGFAPYSVGLTGTGLPTAQLVVSPLQLSFGPVAVGANSAAMLLTVSNPGTGALAGLSFTTASPFSTGSGSCGASLAAEGSCTVPVIFTPQASGGQSGVMTIASTSLGVSAVQAGLSGTGIAAAVLKLAPATLTFSATGQGATSAAQMVTVTNTGGVGAAGLTVTASGDFGVTGSSCAGTLGAGASCSAGVTFSPTAAGARQGFVTAAGTMAGGTNAPVTVSGSLKGTGLTAAALTISPTALNFGTIQIGSTSGTGLMRVTNTGQSEIINLQLAFTAGFKMDATRTTCNGVLGGGGYCLIGVFFAPTVAGAITGSVTASSAGIASAQGSLSGTGAVPPGIVTTPTALVQFGTSGVGEGAPPIAVTVTNSGALTALTGLTLTVDAAGTANGFGLTGNTCGGGTPSGTLGPLASCTVSVTFSPASAGALTGNLTVSSANGGNTVTLALTGTGFDFTFLVVGNASATVVPGQTGYYSVTVTPLSGQAGGSTFSFGCGSLPANALCIFNPAQLTGLANNVAGAVTLGIGTGGAVTTASKPRGAGRRGADVWRGGVLLLCGLAALPFQLLRRWRRGHGGDLSNAARGVALAVLLVVLVGGVSSCAGAGGSGSGGQGDTGGGVVPGSYIVPVTASSNGVSHTVSLTLVVN